MPMNEDGTIRLPTPEEMEQLRDKDQVKQDLSPLLGGGDVEINLESEPSAPPNPTPKIEE